MSVETISHLSAYAYPDVVLHPPTRAVSGDYQKLLLEQGNAIRAAYTTKLGVRIRLTLLEGDPEREAKSGARSDA